MTRLIAWVLLVLLLAPSASAQSFFTSEDSPLYSEMSRDVQAVVQTGLHGADLGLTVHLLAIDPNLREGNPFLSLFKSPGTSGAVKLTLAGTQMVISRKLAKTKPRLAFWLLVGNNVAYAFIVAHNARLMK